MNELKGVETQTIVDGRVNVGYAIKQWETYQQLTKTLLDDSDYQKIGNKKFKKKSAWRKYMRAFNISTTVLEKEINTDDKGRVIDANFLVKAISPDGRFAEGFGNCSNFERKFNKSNHDIPATAMTRATNRAVSDLIGAGEVSAEEMTTGVIKEKLVKKPLSVDATDIDTGIRTEKSTFPHSRLVKAQELIANNAIQKISQNRWKVHSNTNIYTVVQHDSDDWTCDCPDHEYRGVKCKHILATQQYKTKQPTLSSEKVNEIKGLNKLLHGIVDGIQAAGSDVTVFNIFSELTKARKANELSAGEYGEARSLIKDILTEKLNV